MRGERRAALALLTFLTCASAVPTASAHRIAAASQVAVDPNDPARLWMQGTMGLFTSADGGCTWHWICEGALGIRGVEDPPMGVTASGALIAGTTYGVALSEDQGCSWTRHELLPGGIIVDLVLEQRDPSRAVAIVSVNDAATNRYNTEIHRSTDSGRSWARVGTPLGDRIFSRTLRVAPSDSTRLYVAGALQQDSVNGESSEVLLRSADDGQSWETLPIEAAATTFDTFLMAVSPSNPDQLYLRLRGVSGQTVDNRLLYSADGGETWTEIFAVAAQIRALALSPDGSKVLVAVGDPGDVGYELDRSALGIYYAGTADHQFQRGLTGDIDCLHWTDRGVYLCGGRPYPGFQVGLSTDEGLTAEPVMYVAGTQGPLECPAQSEMASVCTANPALWNDVCLETDRCQQRTLDPRPLQLPEKCPAPPAADSKESGCGCSAAGSAQAGAATAGAWLALGLLALRRRRICRDGLARPC